MKILGWALFLAVTSTSCFQAYNSEEEVGLRTVPVTNNPQIVPRVSSGFPGAGF